MFAMLLTLSLGLPLLTALLLLGPKERPAFCALAPWTALPALILSVTTAPGTFIFIPWLLFGGELGLDETGRDFLFFTAMLWLLAGLYALAYLAEDPGRQCFLAFYLLAMLGNLGLVLAGDLASFYLCFALMSFASYVLVLHSCTEEARWAGRVYIVLVMAGEVLLFVGIVAAAWLAGGVSLAETPAALAAAPSGGLVLGFLLIGFGIKAGALPVHVWLPLAHPAAPTPASAVLSGAMIKAGLLGWLRFLPLGEAGHPEWGWLCIAAGLAAAFLGVLVGVVQDNPKVVLAYSSISQMGLMTVGVGAGLLAPRSWPDLLPALWIYATHHALAKGALFLGVGIAASATPGRPRRWVAAGLLLPALALAGAPFTSGAAAKLALKQGLQASQLPGWELLAVLLSLSAVATTVLMARFLLVVWPTDTSQSHLASGMVRPWLALLLAVALAVWLIPRQGFPEAARDALAPAAATSSLWPVAVGAALALLGLRLRPAWAALSIPAGDLLIPVVWLLARLRAGLRTACPRYRWSTPALPKWSAGPSCAAAGQVESLLQRWNIAGLLLLTIGGILIALLIGR